MLKLSYLRKFELCLFASWTIELCQSKLKTIDMRQTWRTLPNGGISILIFWLLRHFQCLYILSNTMKSQWSRSYSPYLHHGRNSGHSLSTLLTIQSLMNNLQIIELSNNLRIFHCFFKLFSLFYRGESED